TAGGSPPPFWHDRRRQPSLAAVDPAGAEAPPQRTLRARPRISSRGRGAAALPPPAADPGVEPRRLHRLGVLHPRRPPPLRRLRRQAPPLRHRSPQTADGDRQHPPGGGPRPLSGGLRGASGRRRGAADLSRDGAQSGRHGRAENLGGRGGDRKPRADPALLSLRDHPRPCRAAAVEGGGGDAALGRRRRADMQAARGHLFPGAGGRMILVTGGSGFLGRHLVRRWATAEPERPMRLLLRRPPDAVYPSSVQVALGDLLDEESVRRAMAGVETVVHLASKNIDRDGTGFERVNVEGTVRLCRAALAAGVSRFVYVSSVGVYGHGSHRDADETTPVHPDTPFSRSKAEAERLVLDGHRRRDWTGIVLRHRFVYGEGDEAVLPRLIRAARKYPFWLSGGRARLSLVLADDFAEVVRRVVVLPREAFSGQDEPAFQVTDGQPIRYREIITEICRAFGYPVPRLSLPFQLVYLPVRARERLLGIDPETSSSSGLTSIRLKLVAQDDFFS